MSAPYVGLRSFGPKDANKFFGRERAVEDLIARLADARFTAVIGASGAGKSSIVRAGLRPALEAGFLDWTGGAWDVVEFRPGGDPIGRLAGALAECDWSRKAAEGETAEQRTLGWKELLRDSPRGLQRAISSLPRKNGEQLLIIVDQFEETFRLPREDASRIEGQALKEAIATRKRQTRVFIDQLLAAANSTAPIYVVVTMRSDFLGECAEYPPLAEAVNRGLFLVSNMTDEELRDAICMPALLAGSRVDPALADALIDEIQGEQFQLPMLQHFLMRAWREGKDKIETEKWLRRKEEKADQRAAPTASAKDGDQKNEKTKLIKTPAEVLNEDLDAAYAELLPDQKKLAEKLFKRITMQRDGKGTRDPAKLKQIADFAETSVKELEGVVTVFLAEQRSFIEALRENEKEPLRDDMLIDITHEAVIYSWGELKRWIRDEAEQARTLEDLWRKSLSGKSLTREEITESWRLLNPSNSSAWAERYVPLFVERYSGELDAVRKFLATSMADADARDLQSALQEGRVSDIAPLIKRRVRLSPEQLKEFRFKAHYYALLPDELFVSENKGGTSSPGETEGGLRTRRNEQLAEVFTPDVLSRKTDRGLSVAHFAAWGGSTEILDYLASNGAPLNDASERGVTPFFWAVTEAQLAGPKWFVTKLGKENTIGKVSEITRRTALHDAAASDNSNAEVVSWLLAEGANVKAVDRSGRTPLDEAAGERDLGRVEALLANGAEAAREAEDGLTPLIALFIYQPYLEARRSAARKPVLDALLNRGAEKSLSSIYGGSTLLHIVIEEPDPADELEHVVKALLDKGASVEARNWSGRTPVELALSRGLTGVALQMAQQNPKDPELWADWLIAAIEANNEEALYELLDISTDGVGRRGRDGKTPLHAASLAAEPWMLYALLDHSPDLEVECVAGDTPLRYAMRHGRADAVRVLMDQGAAAPKLTRFNQEKGLTVASRETIATHLRASLSRPERHWPYGMILSGDWRDCEVEEAIERLLPLYGDEQFALSTFAENFQAVRRLPLVSIENGELCQALTTQGERVSYYTFIVLAGSRAEFSGDFRWFDEVQKNGSLRLRDPAGVGELIRLTYASWQRDGICIVLDNPDRAFLASGAKDESARAKVEERIAATPFRVDPQPVNGRWHGACVLKYSQSIIDAEFSMDAKNGRILHDLKTRIETLPVSREFLTRGFYTSRM